jgi:hypothetical protein
MSKQQMPATKCFTSSNTRVWEELCKQQCEQPMKFQEKGWRENFICGSAENKKPARKSRTGLLDCKEISAARESRSLRRRAGFRRHHYGCHHRR